MQVIDITNYKFERKFTDCDTYQFKITSELLEELENGQNVSEIALNIKGNTGTLTIPSSKSKKAKVFDLNIGPISRGEKESFEVNAFRSNKRVESLGSLQVRLNVQATSKVYDMTKKKITEVEDEYKKHCAKELKLDKFSNKLGLAYKVIKNKEARKSEITTNNSKENSSSILTDKSAEKQYTIREKVLHLLAVKPLSKDALLLRLQRLKVTSSNRHEVDKCLSQLATLNKENFYQLSNQFIHEIQEDWYYYTEEEKRKVKSDLKANFSNRINTTKHSIKPISPYSHEITHPKAQLAPYSSKTKTAASDTSSRKSQEYQIRQSFEKVGTLSDLTLNKDSRTTKLISPSSGNVKSVTSFNNLDEDSNSSFKTHTSHDEGFVSGDKKSPYQRPSTNKRHSQHLDDKNISNKSDPKKLHLSVQNIPQLSQNDTQSSSSCDVTPKSDISQNSSSSLQSKSKLDKKSEFIRKSDSNIIYKTQNQFNTAFEEYSQLCERLKECESKIENLRTKCKSGSEDYTKLYKLAKLLLADVESPKFQALTARVKELELQMFDYLKTLNNI